MIKRLGGLRRKEPPATEPVPAAVPDRDAEALALLRDYESSGVGWFWASDAAGNLTYLSDSARAVFGEGPGDPLGKPLVSLFAPEVDGMESGRTLPLLIAARKTFSDLGLRLELGEREVWWSLSGRPQHDGEGNFLGFRGNGLDVTATLRDQRDARRLVKHDALTGLYNRHYMTRRLDAVLSAYKAGQRSCALMMIDLDRFKHVNDTLGHPVGDALLRQVAERLGSAIGGAGEIGRLGGDEFQVILPDLDDRGRLGELAKNAIDLLSEPYEIGTSRCVIGASVGIAVAPFDGDEPAELVRNADLALYAAKNGGRGQFRFFSFELQIAADKARVLEDDLRHALAEGQLRLVFQPIVSAASNTVVSLEALMRWEHPEYGEVPPSLFLPIAEKTDIIAALGVWTLHEACATAVQWPGAVTVSVNVSPAQFGSTGFVNAVADALNSSGLPAERLELEFSEGIFVSTEDLARTIFNELRQLGVRTVLDNFGSGSSPIACLRRMRFDKIKIDRSIVQDLRTPRSTAIAIAASIATLARRLGALSVAEGIETNEELTELRALEIDQIQGHVYSAPCSAAETLDALASGQWVIEPGSPDRKIVDRRTVYRRVGVIHEDFRYDVIMRNLSRTATSLEGLLDVPVGTEFVVDLGEGQLVVGTVRRTDGFVLEVEFESSLVDDGAGGLVTRHRVPRRLLDAMGMPTPGGANSVVELKAGGINLPRFGTAESARQQGKAA